MSEWTYQEYLSGACPAEHVGLPKPVPPVEPPPVVEVPPLDLKDKSLRQRLTQDALAAYHELGGVEYLKKNPELLDKILARAIAPEPVTNTQNNVNVEWPSWLTARRLAYQESMEVAEDVKLPKPEAD